MDFYNLDKDKDKDLELITDIINNINNKIINDNECQIWDGFKDKHRCLLNYKKTKINIQKFIWKINNPNKNISSKEKIIAVCDNKYCINIYHLKIGDLKKNVTKELLWNRMLKRGRKLENGCLVFIQLKNNIEKNNIEENNIEENKNKNKYNKIRFNNINTSFHKASYWIHSNYKEFSDIPTYNENNESLVIRHLCNNPSCFEPTHLDLGSVYVNNYEDKIDNGTILRGNKNWNCKITEELAQQIKLSKSDNKSMRARAEDFNVPKSIVHAIDYGDSWNHLPDKDGNISNNRKYKCREQRKKNNEKIWTKEMFEEAKIKLYNNSSKEDIIRNEYTNTPCINWNGSISDDGYGIISIFGKKMRTHILACEIKNLEHRPKDLVTRHLCGNRLCCNPEHLKFGTQLENSLDTLNQGLNKKTTLTVDIVKDIKETYEKDNLSKEQRAEKYKISVKNLRMIELGYRWKHIKISSTDEN
jgi:hypothetical protein